MDKVDSLYKAIEIVQKSSYPSEVKSTVVEAIQGCIRKSRAKKWSEENIFAVCDRIVEEHGELLASYLGVGDTPSIAVIRNTFKMSFMDFRAKYYPLANADTGRRHYRHKSNEEWINGFIEQYHKLKPKGQEEYNDRRDKSTPTWITIARMLGLENWGDLLGKLELPYYGTVQTNFEMVYTSRAKDRLAELDAQIAAVQNP